MPRRTGTDVRNGKRGDEGSGEGLKRKGEGRKKPEQKCGRLHAKGNEYCKKKKQIIQLFFTSAGSAAKILS